MSSLNRSVFQRYLSLLVSPSPWPILTSTSLLNLTTLIVLTIHSFSYAGELFIIAIILLISSMFFWLNDLEDNKLSLYIKTLYNKSVFIYFLYTPQFCLGFSEILLNRAGLFVCIFSIPICYLVCLNVPWSITISFSYKLFFMYKFLFVTVLGLVGLLATNYFVCDRYKPSGYLKSFIFLCIATLLFGAYCYYDLQPLATNKTYLPNILLFTIGYFLVTLIGTLIIRIGIYYQYNFLPSLLKSFLKFRVILFPFYLFILYCATCHESFFIGEVCLLMYSNFWWLRLVLVISYVCSQIEYKSFIESVFVLILTTVLFSLISISLDKCVLICCNLLSELNSKYINTANEWISLCHGILNKYDNKSYDLFVNNIELTLINLESVYSVTGSDFTIENSYYVLSMEHGQEPGYSAMSGTGGGSGSPQGGGPGSGPNPESQFAYAANTSVSNSDSGDDNRVSYARSYNIMPSSNLSRYSGYANNPLGHTLLHVRPEMLTDTPSLVTPVTQAVLHSPILTSLPEYSFGRVPSNPFSTHGGAAAGTPSSMYPTAGPSSYTTQVRTFIPTDNNPLYNPTAYPLPRIFSIEVETGQYTIDLYSDRALGDSLEPLMRDMGHWKAGGQSCRAIVTLGDIGLGYTPVHDALINSTENSSNRGIVSINEHLKRWNAKDTILWTGPVNGYQSTRAVRVGDNLLNHLRRD